MIGGVGSVTEKVEVFVNDKKISLYRGLKVKHALIAYDQDAYGAALAGHARVEDENGFALGLEGGLTGGEKIFVKAVKSED